MALRLLTVVVNQDKSDLRATDSGDCKIYSVYVESYEFGIT